MDVSDGVAVSGKNVQTYTYNDTQAQQWKLRRVITDDMVSVGDVIFDGLVFDSPHVNVVAEDTLIEKTDYTTELSLDYSAGKGVVKVTGINSYCGSVTKEFAIHVVNQNIFGDIDSDNRITAYDALCVLQASVGYSQLTDAQRMFADVNSSGNVDAVDALLILQYSIKLINKFPLHLRFKQANTGRG